MEDILLAVLILAFFAFGYFMVARFGKFFNEHHRTDRKHREPDRKVYVAETSGKSTRTVSQEVGLLLGDLSEQDDYEIIICKTADSDIIRYLERSGCTIEFTPRQ